MPAKVQWASTMNSFEAIVPHRVSSRDVTEPPDSHYTVSPALCSPGPARCFYDMPRWCRVMIRCGLRGFRGRSIDLDLDNAAVRQLQSGATGEPGGGEHLPCRLRVTHGNTASLLAGRILRAANAERAGTSTSYWQSPRRGLKTSRVVDATASGPAGPLRSGSAKWCPIRSSS